MNNTDRSFIPYTIIETIRQLDNIYELRLFGWVLAKAQAVLKLYNKNFSEINMQNALGIYRVTFPFRLLLKGPEDKNYKHAWEQVKEMALKKVEFEWNDTDYLINIIAFPELHKHGRNTFVTFVIHEHFWHALHNFSKGYRLISLRTYMQLKTPRAVALYILCSQQSKPITFDIDNLKRLTGATSDGYKKNTNFIVKVLEPAKRELDEVAPWSFDYTTHLEGKTIRKITITPRQVREEPTEDQAEMADQLDRQRVRLLPEVIDYIQDKFGMTAGEIERIERQLVLLSENPASQLDLVSRIYESAYRGKVRNMKGYLVSALKNALGDISLA